MIVGIQEIMKKSYIFVANTVSYQKRPYFDVTSGNFDNSDNENVYEDEIFLRQDILQFSPENPKITRI